MAHFLASIYGTEQDKVNCSFYFKIGACRHGERCSRKHVHPAYSQTILCPNLYQNPKHDPSNHMTPKQQEEHYNAFYEDMYCELCKYGEMDTLVVCDNVGDHLIGNVYAHFKYEEDAQKAIDSLNSRWYNGRPVYAELSPVTDFQEACCRQHETGECGRGGFCNFMHSKQPDPQLARSLYLSQRKSLKLKGKDGSSSRSPSPPVRRSSRY